MVTIVEQEKKPVKLNLMGLDDSIQSQLVGFGLVKTTYKQGIQFELKTGNDFLFKVDCTSFSDDVLVSVKLDYRGEEVHINQTAVEINSEGKVKDKIEQRLLEVFSVLARFKDDEKEFDLDKRNSILEQFKSNLKVKIDTISYYSEELEELSKRVNQIKLA